MSEELKKLEELLANDRKIIEENYKEIERLNNIVNELEKKLLELRLTDVDGKTIVYRLLDKLQELRGVEYVMNDVRPFEEYKEMIKDVRKEEMIKFLYDLSARITEQDKEIERLNNIIKILDNYVIGDRMFEYGDTREDAEQYLQELKGSDK